jgi:hypothetical protein
MCQHNFFVWILLVSADKAVVSFGYFCLTQRYYESLKLCYHKGNFYVVFFRNKYFAVNGLTITPDENMSREKCCPCLTFRLIYDSMFPLSGMAGGADQEEKPQSKDLVSMVVHIMANSYVK